MPCIPAFASASSGHGQAFRDALDADPRFELREATPEDLPARLKELADAQTACVAVAGGDGTLSLAAGALIHTETALVPLPGGTLNHFARALGVPTVPAEALAALADGPRTTVDVGVLNDSVFLNTSAVGAYVVFVRTRERFERFVGYHLASAAAAIDTFVRLPKVQVEIEVEGEARRCVTPLVFVGVGERELRAPKLGDRKDGGRRGLHVLIVRATTRWGLLRMAWRTLRNGVRPWAGEDELESYIVTQFRIAPHRGHLRASHDGEISRYDGPLQYRFDPDALTVIVPAPGTPAPGATTQ